MCLNKRQRLHYQLFFVAGALLFCFFQPALSLSEVLAPQPKAAAVISKKIRPYYEALEGFTSEFKKNSGGETELFEIDDFEKNTSALSVRISSGNFDIALAIGPEASRFILHEKTGRAQKLYLMLLNNDELVSAGGTQPCGVSLSIPVADQMVAISSMIPGVKRLGVIFDPSLNDLFVKNAEAESGKLGISIVRIQARSLQEIVPALEMNIERIDALWMIPDHTVISESIVPFLIKKSMSSGVPSIGYNRYFIQNGSAMAFVINYEGTGIKAARMAAGMIKDKKCSWEPPDFEPVRNEKVIEIFKGRAGMKNQLILNTQTGAAGDNGHK